MNMRPLREYDKVRIVKLLRSDRPFEGTEGVMRPPAIGDTATVVHEYQPDKPSAVVAVEKVSSDGYTIWLADFEREELQLIQDPGQTS